MSTIITVTMAKLAKSVLNELQVKYGEDLKKVSFDFITNTIEGILIEKRTLDEWASIVIKTVDNIIDKTVVDYDYKYIGGILKFSFRSDILSEVTISYDLYFSDRKGNYFKNSATSTVNKDNFVKEDLDKLKEIGTICYEVEGGSF